MTIPKIQAAVRRVLRSIPAADHGAEGALALKLAKMLDDGEVVSTAPACARELRETLKVLRARVPDRPPVNFTERLGWDPGGDPQLRALAEDLARN
jgi:hypothetical protein